MTPNVTERPDNTINIEEEISLKFTKACIVKIGVRALVKSDMKMLIFHLIS